MGIEVERKNVSGKKHKLDLSHLPKGFYTLSVQSGNEVINTKLILH
jgi:hypothetical protein